MFDQTPIMSIGLDFHFYWAAGHALLQGQNPYDHAVFEAAVLESGFPTGYDIPWYPYLPISLIWLLPFALVSFGSALLPWYLFLVGGFFVILLCSRTLRPLSVESIPWPPLLLVALAFPPVLRAFMLGQLTIILVAIILLALVSIKKDRALAAGLLCSLAVCKPQSLTIVIPLLISAEWQVRSSKFLLGLLLGIAGQCAIVLWIRPTILQEYFSFALTTAPQLVQLNKPGFATLLSQLGLPGAALVIPALASFSAFLFPFFKRVTLPGILCIAIPLSILVAPYGWVHESVLLVPAIFLIGSLSYERWDLTGMLPFLAIFIPLLFLIPGSRIEAAAPYFPLAVIALYILVPKLRGLLSDDSSTLFAKESLVRSCPSRESL